LDFDDFEPFAARKEEGAFTRVRFLNPDDFTKRPTIRRGAGLPDGFFSDQNYQIGYILEGLGMENVVIYSGHLEYFTTIGYI
jgi:hypothetical protein